MQNLRRALALRLPLHDTLTSSIQWQQAAAMSKITKTESGSGDSKLQLMMKALEPQAVEDITMSPEELAEAERRSVLNFTLCSAFYTDEKLYYP